MRVYLQEARTSRAFRSATVTDVLGGRMITECGANLNNCISRLRYFPKTLSNTTQNLNLIFLSTPSLILTVVRADVSVAVASLFRAFVCSKVSQQQRSRFSVRKRLFAVLGYFNP